jgi:hypothetical protein
MKTRRILTAALAGALAIGLLAGPAAAGGRPLSADLTGAAEVAPGDPDGSGTMDLTLNQGQEEICFDLAVAGIAAPTRAHIHRGEAGSNGPIVVFFFDVVIPDPIPVAFDGCVDVPADLIKEIRQNPDGFYINVHNAEFPAGAIRGQLNK